MAGSFTVASTTISSGEGTRRASMFHRPQVESGTKFSNAKEGAFLLALPEVDSIPMNPDTSI